jgi:S-DNA-T family DNA segregation ATPase FtsK/SpoIIIE
MWSSGDGERGGGPDPLLGLYDNPLEQEQVVYQPERARGGHLLVLGSASSGKSTLLRTLVTSLARTHTPQEAHVYVFDFGGQSTLKVLEGFPHVGAVVTRFEPERVQRLILHLQAEVSKRNELFRKAQVDSLDDYNARVPERARLPSVHVLIDGFADFKRALEIELVRQVSALLGGAAAIGLRMVVAASLQADVPNDLFANIDQRLTFHQADQTEYFRIVGQPSQAKLQEEVSRRPPPGRGLLRATPPLEFQAALPTQAQDHTQQTEQLNTLAEAMRRTWEGPLPQQIRALPLLVTLPPAQRRSGSAKDRFRPELHATIGQDYETLAPTRLSLDEDGPTFLIAGAAPGSGKTTLMRTWLLGLGETYRARALHILLLDFHTRTLAPLRGLPHCQEYVGTQAMLEDALARLGDLIHARRERLEQAYQQDPEGFDSERLVRSWPYSLVAIDDYEHFATQCEQQRPRLADLLTQGTDLGVGFLVAGNAAELPRDFDDPFMQRTRRHGCGALLGAAEGLDQFNNARRPPGSPLAALPPGRGFLVTRGHVRLFQAAVYWQEGEEPNPALSRRVQRVSARAQPKQAGPPA